MQNCHHARLFSRRLSSCKIVSMQDCFHAGFHATYVPKIHQKLANSRKNNQESAKNKQKSLQNGVWGPFSRLRTIVFDLVSIFVSFLRFLESKRGPTWSPKSKISMKFCIDCWSRFWRSFWSVLGAKREPESMENHQNRFQERKRRFSTKYGFP